MRGPHAVVRLSGPIAVALAGAAMLAWTWQTWPDPLIDFGKELYIPWQLAQGKVLYRDVAYFLGPLSPYVNALWFRAFGASLRGLEALNLLVLIGVAALLYRLLLEIADRLTAAVGGVLLMTLFAFGRYVDVANYNFTCPYTHEVTHGLLLALASLAVRRAMLRRRQAMDWAAAGLLLGMCFLTRGEMFLAAAVGVSAGVLLSMWAEGFRAWHLGGFVIACLIPPAIAFGLLWFAMPAREALVGTLGSWPATLAGDVARLELFRDGMGLLDPVESLREMCGQIGVWGFGIIILIVLAMQGRITARGSIGAIMLASSIALISWLLWPERMNWLEKVRPLTFFVLVVVICLLVGWYRRRSDLDARRQIAVRLGFALFAGALLLKMILRPRMYHYGFVLALPATMVVAAALLSWVPRVIARAGGSATLMRVLVLMIFGAAVIMHLLIIKQELDKPKVWVGAGADSFLADADRGAWVNEAAVAIARRVRPDETVAVLPEGAMLNFLARRANPTPYVNFMPTEMLIFGEARITQAFREHPPDYVVLVHKDTVEFGSRYFATDYARELGAWIAANYEGVWLRGAIPLREPKFGILIMKRRSSPSPLVGEGRGEG